MIQAVINFQCPALSLRYVWTLSIFHRSILHCYVRCASLLAICLSGLQLLRCSALYSQRPHFRLAVMSGLLSSKHLWADKLYLTLSIYFRNTSPLRNQLKLLTQIDPIKRNADSRLGFVLHTITGFHRPSLTHYYGFICHLTLILTLSHLLRWYVQPIWLDAVPGFPSYCSDSLLEMPPSNTALA